MPNFSIHQQNLCNLIDSDSFGSKKFSITKTDYFQNNRGDYLKYFEKHILKDFELDFKKKWKNSEIRFETIWYQVYGKNSFHDKHTHTKTNFTNVFYIQLPSNNMVSQLWDEDDKKINMKIKEGDILTFPGFISHNSKINLSDKQKIVISFNFSLESI